MQEGQEKHQKRLKKLLEVAVDGEQALLEHIFEIEDKLEEIELQKGDTGEKGDKGDSYELTEQDKLEIASLIEVPIVEKVVEKIIEKTEVIKEQPIVKEITKVTNEIKEVALKDTPDEIIEKINSREGSINFKTINGFPDYSDEIKRLKSIVNSTPAITTSFINGVRAKNLNFIGADISYKDDTATVDINDFLKLDQTTPQTISNGIPLLNVNLTDFTNEKQIVNKEYVDNAINFISDYYFNNTADAIGGIYYQMTDRDLAEAGATLTTGTLTSGDDQAVFNFITENALGVNKLNSGVYKVHIHSLKTGTRSVNLYVKIYVRTSGGTETLVATSTDTVALGLTDGEYDLSASVASPVTINSTDKLLVKFFANVGASGSDVTVSLNLEDDYNSRLSVPIESDVLNQIFLRQDGTKALTANWNAGAFGITANDFTVNTATANTLTYFNTSKTLSSVALSGLTLTTGTLSVNSAALTKTDDTNVTLTLGGSPTTALLNATSLTLGWTGQLAVGRGGTGIASYTIGDLLYASGTTTLSKLADVATGNALISGGVGVAPSWGKIGLTTHISGTLGVGNGGTGTATTFTQGSIIFAGASGIYTEDNANFFWDNTNKQLKIGSNSIVNGNSLNPIAIAKTSTSYLATYIQNLSSGTAASTDLIIGNNADDGTVSTGTYLDMGINSSGYTGAGLTNGPGDAYIFNNLEDLIIGTGTAGKNVIIGTNIFTGTAASKTRATFTDTGLQMMNGSASAPSVSGTGATTTGFYWAATPSILTAIAGVNRLTHSATNWTLNSSNGGSIDIGGIAQYMDFGGTIVPNSATTQLIRTAAIFAPDVNRTNIFGINNTNIIGGSTTGITLTTMSANRAANQFQGSVGITVTNAAAFDARDINNSSSGTVSVTNNYGFYVSQVQAGGATINAAFAAINTAAATRWNLYMSGTAQNYLEGSLGIGVSAPSTKLHVLQSSLGTGVMRLVSTATNDDPTFEFAQGRVATTNATITTVETIATTTDTTIQIKAEVIGRRTGGTAGTAGDGAGYFIIGTFNNIGGTITQIGTTTNLHTAENQAGWDCVFTISGTNILVQITGATNNQVVWHCHADYKQVGT